MKEICTPVREHGNMCAHKYAEFHFHIMLGLEVRAHVCGVCLCVREGGSGGH